MEEIVKNEFQFYSKLAKPLVLNLPKSKDRILAAAWIMKLREEAAGDERLRTIYLKLLLFCLQRRRLTGIFADDPANYDMLEALPPDIDLNEFARNLMDQEKAERREIIRLEMMGDMVTFPAFTTDCSPDLTEYVAAQDIPNFGVHAFYAISRQPVSKWQRADKAILPKGTKSAIDTSVTAAAAATASCVCPPKGTSSAPEVEGEATEGDDVALCMKPQTESATPEKKKRRPKKLGTSPPTHPIGEVRQPTEEERPTPTWGTNLLEVRERTDIGNIEEPSDVAKALDEEVSMMFEDEESEDESPTDTEDISSKAEDMLDFLHDFKHGKMGAPKKPRRLSKSSKGAKGSSKKQGKGKGDHSPSEGTAGNDEEPPQFEDEGTDGVRFEEDNPEFDIDSMLREAAGDLAADRTIYDEGLDEDEPIVELFEDEFEDIQEQLNVSRLAEEARSASPAISSGIPVTTPKASASPKRSNAPERAFAQEDDDLLRHRISPFRPPKPREDEKRPRRSKPSEPTDKDPDLSKVFKRAQKISKGGLDDSFLEHEREFEELDEFANESGGSGKCGAKPPDVSFSPGDADRIRQRAQEQEDLLNSPEWDMGQGSSPCGICGNPPGMTEDEEFAMLESMYGAQSPGGAAPMADYYGADNAQLQREEVMNRARQQEEMLRQGSPQANQIIQEAEWSFAENLYSRRAGQNQVAGDSPPPPHQSAYGPPKRPDDYMTPPRPVYGPPERPDDFLTPYQEFTDDMDLEGMEPPDFSQLPGVFCTPCGPEGAPPGAAPTPSSRPQPGRPRPPAQMPRRGGQPSHIASTPARPPMPKVPRNLFDEDEWTDTDRRKVITPPCAGAAPQPIRPPSPVWSTPEGVAGPSRRQTGLTPPVYDEDFSPPPSPPMSPRFAPAKRIPKRGRYPPATTTPTDQRRIPSPCQRPPQRGPRDLGDVTPMGPRTGLTSRRIFEEPGRTPRLPPTEGPIEHSPWTTPCGVREEDLPFEFEPLIEDESPPAHMPPPPPRTLRDDQLYFPTEVMPCRTPEQLPGMRDLRQHQFVPDRGQFDISQRTPFGRGPGRSLPRESVRAVQQMPHIPENVGQPPCGFQPRKPKHISAPPRDFTSPRIRGPPSPPSPTGVDDLGEILRANVQLPPERFPSPQTGVCPGSRRPLVPGPDYFTGRDDRRAAEEQAQMHLEGIAHQARTIFDYEGGLLDTSPPPEAGICTGPRNVQDWAAVDEAMLADRQGQRHFEDIADQANLMFDYEGGLLDTSPPRDLDRSYYPDVLSASQNLGRTLQGLDLPPCPPCGPQPTVQQPRARPTGPARPPGTYPGPRGPSARPPARPPMRPPARQQTKPPMGPPARPPARPPAKPQARPPMGPPARPPMGPPARPPARPPMRMPAGPPQAPLALRETRSSMLRKQKAAEQQEAERKAQQKKERAAQVAADKKRVAQIKRRTALENQKRAEAQVSMEISRGIPGGRMRTPDYQPPRGTASVVTKSASRDPYAEGPGEIETVRQQLFVPPPRPWSREKKKRDRRGQGVCEPCVAPAAATQSPDLMRELREHEIDFPGHRQNIVVKGRRKRLRRKSKHSFEQMEEIGEEERSPCGPCGGQEDDYDAALRDLGMTRADADGVFNMGMLEGEDEGGSPVSPNAIPNLEAQLRDMSAYEQQQDALWREMAGDLTDDELRELGMTRDELNQPAATPCGTCGTPPRAGGRGAAEQAQLTQQQILAQIEQMSQRADELAGVRSPVLTEFDRIEQAVMQREQEERQYFERMGQGGGGSPTQCPAMAQGSPEQLREFEQLEQQFAQQDSRRQQGRSRFEDIQRRAMIGEMTADSERIEMEFNRPPSPFLVGGTPPCRPQGSPEQLREFEELEEHFAMEDQPRGRSQYEDIQRRAMIGEMTADSERIEMEFNRVPSPFLTRTPPCRMCSSPQGPAMSPGAFEQMEFEQIERQIAQQDQRQPVSRRQQQQRDFGEIQRRTMLGELTADAERMQMEYARPPSPFHGGTPPRAAGAPCSPHTPPTPDFLNVCMTDALAGYESPEPLSESWSEHFGIHGPIDLQMDEAGVLQQAGYEMLDDQAPPEWPACCMSPDRRAAEAEERERYFEQERQELRQMFGPSPGPPSPGPDDDFAASVAAHRIPREFRRGFRPKRTLSITDRIGTREVRVKLPRRPIPPKLSTVQEQGRKNRYRAQTAPQGARPIQQPGQSTCGSGACSSRGSSGSRTPSQSEGPSRTVRKTASIKKIVTKRK